LPPKLTPHACSSAAPADGFRVCACWHDVASVTQATQFKDMLLVALQSAAVLTVLETFWLVGNKAWLQEHIGARATEATRLH
jgi:hypothetical protein